jgi:uncharacterized membrane protein (DUF4010 family)
MEPVSLALSVDSEPPLVAYATAAAIGLVLGFEREHHEWHRHQTSVAAGTRTNAVVALVGAVSARIDAVVVAGGAVAVTLLVAVGYWRTANEHVGTTTEFTTMAAFVLGALCVVDQPLAAGLGAAIAMLLESKELLRRLLREVVSSAEVEDAIRWFALAFVVWPLMPTRSYGGDAAIVPHDVWRLVLILTGIGWIGHVATRAIGVRRGVLVTGATGGFVSGAATTAAMARIARQDPSSARSALAGACLASVATLVQLVVMTSIAVPDFGVRVVPAMAAGSLTLVAAAFVVLRRHATGQSTPADLPVHDNAVDDDAVTANAAFGSENGGVETADDTTHTDRPLHLTSALAAAVLLTAALAISNVLRQQVGSKAVVITSAAVGLADTHAAALSAASSAGNGVVSEPVALAAVGVGLATNTLTKLLLASVAGGLGFAVRLAALLAPTIATVGVGIWLTAR